MIRTLHVQDSLIIYRQAIFIHISLIPHNHSYINDLSFSLKHTKTFLFADDTKCLRSICSPHDCILLQSDLDALSSWSTNWKLKFNENKWSVLSIISGCASTTQSAYQYLINELPISLSTQQKDLGIIISSDLSCLVLPHF